MPNERVKGKQVGPCYRWTVSGFCSCGINVPFSVLVLRVLTIKSFLGALFDHFDVLLQPFLRVIQYLSQLKDFVSSFHSSTM